jgi:hypothetical protein
MRQPIKLIIKKGKVQKDGASPIFIQYCYSSTRRVLISTGIGIPTEFWNKKTGSIFPGLPAEYGNSQLLEVTLRENLRKAEKLVDYAVKKNNLCPMRFLKKNFREGDNFYLEQLDYDHHKLDVFYQIEKYITDKKDLVQPCTLTVIRSMKKHLLSFQQPPSFIGL